MIKEYPKTLYRAGPNGLEHRSFASEDAIEAGWVSHSEAKAKVVVVAAPVVAAKGDAAKVKALEARLVDLEKARKDAEDSAVAANAQADELAAQLETALAMIDELKTKPGAEATGAAKTPAKPKSASKA